MEKYNKYDCVIIVLIASLAFGHFELFRAFHPIRILGLLLIPIYIHHGILSYYRHFSNWMILFGVWAVYMFFSLLWTPDVYGGFVGTFVMFSMFLCITLLFFCVKRAENPIHSLCRGWLLFALLTLPIAYWEIFTGNHLSSGSFNANDVINNHYRVFAAVTFRNLNSYVLMLCYSIPFLVMMFIDNSTKRIEKVFSLLTYFLVTIVLIINASRGGYVCLIISLLILFCYIYIKINVYLKILITTAIVMVFIYFLDHLEDINLFFQIYERFSSTSSAFEDDNRIYLIIEGLKIFYRTCFLGGGIGSMTSLYEQYTDSNILYAHNMFIELLIEYGLIIPILLFYMIFKSIFRMRNTSNMVIRYLFLYSLCTFPFIIAVDDGYQTRSGIWIYLASIVSISSLCITRKSSLS